MVLDTIVKYQSGAACFRIRKKSAGVYSADLIYFDGDQKILPPQHISLLRGIPNWTGSCQDQNLLNDLGKLIEKAYSDSSTSIFK